MPSGSQPAVPKPVAPPTSNDAARNLLAQGKKKKTTGFQSTILTGRGTMGNPTSTNATSTILGG